MNKRDRALVFRLAQLGVILLVLILGIGELARSSSQTDFLGMPSRTFYGIVGLILVIYVSFAFSKFMFKNLPSSVEQAQKDDISPISPAAAARASELKYSAQRGKDKSKFDKYYSFGGKG